MRINQSFIVRSRAPLRLGFAGGGTDLSPYCDQFGGAVLNCAICKYAIVSMSILSTETLQVVAKDLGRETEISIDALQRGGSLGGDFALVEAVYRRVCRDYLNGFLYPLRIETHVDAPMGSGLGSSSALVVALVEAFVFAFDLPLGKYEVGHLAWQIEREDLEIAGGKQDQYAAAFGGINFMEFYGENRVIVNPLRLTPASMLELEASIVIAYTGVSRQSSNIISDQVRTVYSDNVDALGSMHALRNDAYQLKAAILRWDAEAISQTLNRSWESKKKTSNVMTSDAIDRIYERALVEGALGGKISGAGGGGFMMFFVDPVKRHNLRKILSEGSGSAEYVTFDSQGALAWAVPRLARFE